MKALSPMIATVLLIAFTATVAGLLIAWYPSLFQTQSGTVESQVKQVVSCSGGFFGLSYRKACLENLKRGLVLWLKLDEGSGTTVADSSGYGNSGTLYSGATVCSNPPTAGCPTWVDGKIGKALSFDGVDDYVDLRSRSSLDITNQITITAWVKFTGTTQQNIYSRGEYYGGKLGVEATIISKQPNFWLGNGVTAQYLTASQVLTENEWHYLAFVWDGTIKKIYIDDKSDPSTQTFTGPISYWHQNAMIGRRSSVSMAYFNGTIDEVRIYNRALSAEEIQALYYAGLTNKFNVTFLLLNKGLANLGFNFSAALFLQNKTVINKRFDLNSSFRAAATEEVELNFDDYYPGYADIEKLKVCSIACPGVCAEIKETMC
jgi:hypothetical protein